MSRVVSLLYLLAGNGLSLQQKYPATTAELGPYRFFLLGGPCFGKVEWIQSAQGSVVSFKSVSK